MRRVYTCRIGLAGRCFPWRSVDSPSIYYFTVLFKSHELGATCPDCIPYGLVPKRGVAGNGQCMIIVSEDSSVRAVSSFAVAFGSIPLPYFPRISENI